MKKYVTWNAIIVNPNRITHINTDNFASSFDNDFIFTETQYQGQLNPALLKFIWFLEYPDTKTESEINQYNSHIASYQVQDKTESEVNALLLDWYWLDDELNQLITVSNYIFTDNTPNII